jgi:hypothetical protein
MIIGNLGDNLNTRSMSSMAGHARRLRDAAGKLDRTIPGFC